MRIRRCIATLIIGMLCMVTTVHAEEYEYDQLNRVTKVIYEDGSYVTYEYDANGNMVKTDVYEVVREDNMNPETNEPVQSQTPTAKPEPAVSRMPEPSPLPIAKPEPVVSQIPEVNPHTSSIPDSKASQRPEFSQMPSVQEDKDKGKTQLYIKVTKAIQKILVKINMIKEKVFEQVAMKQEKIDGISSIQSDKTVEYDKENNEVTSIEGQQEESNNMDSERTNEGYEYESVMQFVKVIEQVIAALINWIQILF